MSKIQLLLVEDDPILGKGLKLALELEGYKIHWAQSLKSAEELERASSLQLIVLDLNLPDGNGITFLETVRKSGSRIPIIILTAKTNEEAVVEGFQAGATDYVRKPFGNKELFVRIRAALREPQIREPQIRYDEILILIDQRKAMFGEKEIELNRREFDVLSYFVQHPETVVTREALLSQLDKDGEIYDRTIDSHVSHVRSKLRQVGAHSVQISSVYGVGYRLERK